MDTVLLLLYVSANVTLTNYHQTASQTCVTFIIHDEDGQTLHFSNKQQNFNDDDDGKDDDDDDDCDENDDVDDNDDGDGVESLRRR